MLSTTVDPNSDSDAVQTPSVLVVLVAKDGLPWLRECLQSVSAQSYPRLAVLAVDNGSTDASRELLEQALGAGRVLALGEGGGFAGAVRAALELPVCQAADYVLILHDDAALGPDAIAHMVEAAEGIRGVERVGIVGPKVVDWDDPRILRDVGRSADRFGHPYSPLLDDEMDQGQFDRVLEVFFVSSCAMLVSREVWRRTGSFDERFRAHGDDLDFCWRARLAGFRVLMTPLAQVRHRAATMRGERPSEAHRERSPRYHAERAALASMLKNFGILTLLWLIPLHFVLGFARLAGLALSRRFEDAFELLSAWTWNAVRLPGTLRRRVRAQSVRTVRDHALHRFMHSALRIPKWVERAEHLLEEEIEEEREGLPLRARAATLAAEHPVLVAWALAAIVAALAYRGLVGPEPLTGGALSAFPARAGDFFRELASGVRTTGLGGAQPASPALAALGALSWVAFGSPALAQKALLALLPAVASITAYRATLRHTERRVAAVLAGASYALSAVVMWAFSEGRIGSLVAAAVMPAAMDRLDSAFGRKGPERRLRFVVGTGAAMAVGVASLPGVLPALGTLLGVHLLFARRRGRGLLLAVGSAGVGAALVFPIVPTLVAHPAAELGSTEGTRDLWQLARLATDSAPGSWPLAWFLPVAAVMALSVVGSEHLGRAWRAALVAAAGLFLAWASTNGWLPPTLSNAPVYVTMAAAAEAALVGHGIASLSDRLAGEAFGLRQVAAMGLGAVLLVGFLTQSFAAAFGGWGIGPNRNEPAWPVIASSADDFRVLWLGRPDGDRFPAPGGEPSGVVEAGDASVRWTLTDGGGATALDTGRGQDGPGFDYAVRAVRELVSGETRNGGALLSILGVRFIVAEQGDLPAPVTARLGEQLDLDLVPAGGLAIYRNATALPPAALVASEAFSSAAAATDLAAIAGLPPAEATPLVRVDAGWAVPSGATGYAFVGEQFSAGWVAGDGRAEPERAFGWAMGFRDVSGVAITYERQRIRTAETWLLGVLWLVALWLTRKPVSR